MLKFALGLALALLWAGYAVAGDQAQYGPPAPWVKPTEIPQPLPDSTTDVQILLEDFQNDLGPDGDDYYEEIAERIQTPQGLDKVGSVVLEWRPDIEDLIIHKLHIIRDGKVIDVLANGQKFLILRRENNLELAMLDGSLTAAIQPEGLQVGDTLDLAFTQQMRDPLFKGHAQLLMRNPGMSPIRHLIIREIWPASKTLQWRQTEGLSPARVTDKPEGKELAIDMVDTKPIKAPRDAPGRFSHINRLEISEFSSWGEVSALMSPLYEKASHLEQESPIKAEAAKIAAASTDPKVRAAAALHVVQDEIRYLFLGMDRGGYIPADADKTWTRRFGDCKGKTVLLLALLRELGIDAQPAMVSSGDGDGLDAVLPMVRPFDHVLVRASIGGNIYWLDGTRTGDRGLDDIAIPDFSWALPLQRSGAVLEKLVTKPLDKPQTLTELRLDASKGLDVPATAHAEQTLRGDDGTRIKLLLGGKPQSDVDSYLKQFWTGQYNWIDIKHVGYAFDDQSGEARLSMDGTGKMDWKIYGGYGGRQFEVDDSRLGWTPDYNRDPGPHDDAPFVVRFPYYVSKNTIIVLPQSGVGFTTQGANVDRQAAGYELKRHSQTENGVFVMTRSIRSTASEFAAADAPAAKTTLHDLSEVAVYLRAPPSLNGTAQEGAGSLSPTKSSTDVMMALASEASAKGDIEKAIKAFGDVIAVDSRKIEALTARGFLYLSKGDLASATADIEKARRIDPQNQGVLAFGVMLAMAKKDFGGALALADEQVKLRPGDGKFLGVRAGVYAAQGNAEKAQADYDEAARLEPDNPGIRFARVQFFLSQHEGGRALSEADRLIALAPDNAGNHDIRGFVLSSLGRGDEALVEYNAALSIRPDAGTYLRRARIRNSQNTQDILADLESSLKLQPKNPEAHEERAKIYLAQGDFRDALSDLNAVLELVHDDAQSLHRRAFAYAGLGNYDAAVKGVSELLARRHNDADLLMERCRYRAAGGRDLDAALADCRQASAVSPDAGDIQIATAFADQKSGHFEDAMKVYDGVLSRRSNSATALFGRGMTEIAMGQIDRGKSDLTAARKTNANIDQDMKPFFDVPEQYRAEAPDMKERLGILVADVADQPGRDQAAVQTRMASGKKSSRKPISIVRPRYPSIAEDYQVEGYVDFEFTVEENGTVGEPKVVREYPEMNGFADAAIRVFPKWKFAPEIIDGKAVPTRAFYRFSFKLG